MTTTQNSSVKIQTDQLSVSLSTDIDKFKLCVDEREGQKLFAQARLMLLQYESQRAVLFDKGGAFETNYIEESHTLLALIKITAKQKSVLRMITMYDAENDQVNLALQLIIDLTILTLLMNGDGVSAAPIYKNGVFYTFTRVQRPAQPLLKVFKNYMISFVRPLHSIETVPEWESFKIDDDWDQIVQEIGWNEFIEIK